MSSLFKRTQLPSCFKIGSRVIYYLLYSSSQIRPCFREPWNVRARITVAVRMSYLLSTHEVAGMCSTGIVLCHPYQEPLTDMQSSAPLHRTHHTNYAHDRKRILKPFHGMILDPFLFLTSNIRSFLKSCWIHLQKRSRIYPLLPTFH